VPKQITEIRNFQVGVMTNPEEGDIPLDASPSSLNIEPMNIDGRLEGVPADTTQISGLKANVMSSINNDGQTDLIYFEKTGLTSRFKSVVNFPTASTIADISGSNESSIDTPSMVPNNKEIHVGTGRDNEPKWIGYIPNGQFDGSAPSGIQVENANLDAPSTLPPLDKTILIGSYLYGYQDGDTRLYKINASTGVKYKNSLDIFSSIRSIAYHNGTHLWVLDKVSDTTGEIKLVDLVTLEVTQTSSFTGIEVRGNTGVTLPSGMNDDIGNNNPATKSFSTWFGTNLGGGSDWLTDIIETDGAIWLARGGVRGYRNDLDGDSDTYETVRWRFLYKLKDGIPTENGNVTVRDVSFRCFDSSGVNSDNNNAGSFYQGNSSADGADTISVRLQVPNKCLVDCGGAVGFCFQVERAPESEQVHTGGTTAGICFREGENDATTDLTDASNSNHPFTMLLMFRDSLFTGTSDFFTNVTLENDSSSIIKKVKFRKLKQDSSGTTLHNKYIRAISYTGQTTSRGAITFSEKTTNQARSYVALADSFETYSDGANVVDDFQIEFGTGYHANYELKNAYPTAYGTGSNAITVGTTLYSSRTSVGIDDKKHQLIKSVATGSGGSTSFSYNKQADVSFSFDTSGEGAKWPSGTKRVYYKTSYTYDGYQEGPLSTAFIFNIDTDTKKVKVTVNLHEVSNLSKRVTHVNLYSASATDDSSLAPDGFYRLVDSYKLTTGWSSVSGDELSNDNPAWGTYRSKMIYDNGTATTSYEARTGINELLNDTLPKYGLSASLNNQLYIADCKHPEIDDATNYLFKSRPYRYSQFNWINDFLVLPAKPTAIAGYNNRLYVFTKNTTYRIEPNNLYIEDTFEGIGCINQDCIVVTEYGMFFCDDTNIYMHDGVKARPIGYPILRGVSSVTNSDYRSVHSYLNLAGRSYRKIAYDGLRRSVLVFGERKVVGASTNYIYSCLAYTIPKQRWDIWEIEEGGTLTTTDRAPKAFFAGKEGQVYYSNGTNLIYYMGHASNKRSWDWNSKEISANLDSINKMFIEVYVSGAPSSSATIYIDGASLTTTTSDNKKINIPSSSRKGKKMRVKLSNQTGHVDSIGVIYRPLKVSNDSV